ncbi:3-oxoadipate enol-lactonase [Povalibacter sp.]|uniref:3-oxoadipate enol-lactonase n=1 Tax=Povalibacter sp. TaxID=1962978 RepID=UPI002F3FF277
MKVATTDDAQLHYEHAPRPGAPALLLLNSLGTSLEMWDDQVQVLQEHFEVVRYDVRGHGQSSAGSRTELTLEQLARDALVVLDACEIARAHLCGLSLGGMTSMVIARHWPDRVLKTALSNTSPHMPPRESWDSRIQTARTQGMSALTEGILGRWFTAGFRSAEPERVERVRQMLLATNPAGYAACCAAVRDMDLREDIKDITTTTLVIGGTKDPATPPADAELIANSIPGAKLRMLEAAHLSNIEQAEEFTAALVEFLGTI